MIRSKIANNPALIGLLLASALFISACAPSAVESPTSTNTLQVAIEELAISLPEAACTVVSSQARDDTLLNSPYPPFSSADWQRGASDPLVTIIEYGDFQCPFCGALAPVLLEIDSLYGDQISIAFRHYPLIGSAEEPIHEKAALAAQASEAAGLQDAFWPMHDLLFEHQLTWTDLSEDDFTDFLNDAAAELGLDTAQFEADLLSPELVTLAEDAWLNGQALGIGGTPFLLINGFPYQGPQDVASLDAIIQLELLIERQFNECPAFTLDLALNYIATIRTEKGDVIIQLLPDIAPTAVNSFVFLAENDWYDNVTFHRVLPGFMAQAGDPTGTGFGGPGYAFEIEPHSSYLFDRAGLLAMANSGPTSNGSQFFITYADASHLNGGFTIFGEVLQGMDVLESLTPRDPSASPNLAPGDLILDVIIEAN